MTDRPNNRNPERGDVLWYRTGNGNGRRIVIVLGDGPIWGVDNTELSYIVLCGTEQKHVSALHLRWTNE